MGKKRGEVECTFAIGERVRHDNTYGNYDWGTISFEGVVVACFLKRDRSSLRYVVESDRGSLQIFKPSDLAHVFEKAARKTG